MSKPSDAQRPQSRRRPRRRPTNPRVRASGRLGHEATGSSESRFVDDARKQRSPRVAHATAHATPAASATSKASAGATYWDIVRPHVKRFAVPLLINHAVTVGIFLAISVVVGIGAGFSRVPATVASLWMVANLGSLDMKGAVLGFLPLLPALIMVWAHARRMTKTLGTSVSVRGLRVFVALALAIPLLLTVIAWLMLWDASRVFDMAAPNLLDALVSTLLVNGAAVVVGMRARIWRALLLRRQWPTWPVEAFRLAASFLRTMVAVGLVACLIYMATNSSAVVDSYGITRNLMGAFGLTVVALAYLPNFAIGAMAVLLGGEFHVGNGVVTLFTSTNVNLPPLPTMAAVPHATLPGGPAYMLLTAVIAVWTVYRFLARREFVEAPVATAVGAGAACAFLAFCIAWLSGGEMGVYGSVGALEWLTAAEAAAWLMLPALVVMLYASRKGSAVREDVASLDTGDQPASPSSSTPPAEKPAATEAKQGQKAEAEDTEADEAKERQKAEAQDSEADESGKSQEVEAKKREASEAKKSSANEAKQRSRDTESETASDAEARPADYADRRPPQGNSAADSETSEDEKDVEEKDK